MFLQGEAIGSAQPGSEAIVAIGTQDVHTFLLHRLRALVWRSATARARHELAQASAVLFARHATDALLEALPWGAAATIGAAAAAAAPPPPLALAAFRPLVAAAMRSQLVPGPRVTHAALVVPAILAALRQRHLRTQLRQSLHEQVRSCPVAR